jgi:hypothetical protein
MIPRSVDFWAARHEKKRSPGKGKPLPGVQLSADDVEVPHLSGEKFRIGRSKHSLPAKLCFRAHVTTG